jgi:CheY-like chemotaxis protein
MLDINHYILYQLEEVHPDWIKPIIHNWKSVWHQPLEIPMEGTNKGKRKQYMLYSTKVLIHDDRSDTPEFLLEIIVNRGYKAGFAKCSAEIIAMLSNDQYDVVLTNGGYKELNTDQYIKLKSSSVFIIDIKDSRNRNQDMELKADLYLPRPFLISELWQALEKPFQ